MPNIKPFRAIRPAPEFVEEMHIYHGDAGDAVRARDKALSNPHSMLQVSRADLLLSDEEAKDEALVRSQSRTTFKRLSDEGALVQDREECLYFYRLSFANHSQTGIVACFDVQDYIDGVIKRHELTRIDKIHVQEKLIERVGGNLEPVLLVYDSENKNKDIVKISETWTLGHDSIYDFYDAGGVRHELWAVDDKDIINKLKFNK